MSILTNLARGAVAGAAGTAALNMTTYADMALRGRPASSTPERTVERGAELAGVDVPGEGDARDARVTALGSLSGSVAGVAAGAVLGVLRGDDARTGTAATLGTAFGLAMVAGNGPMTVLGVTNPATWAAKDWVADVVPHLAYALVATAALELMRR